MKSSSKIFSSLRSDKISASRDYVGKIFFYVSGVAGEGSIMTQSSNGKLIFWENLSSAFKVEQFTSFQSKLNENQWWWHREILTKCKWLGDVTKCDQD